MKATWKFSKTGDGGGKSVPPSPKKMLPHYKELPVSDDMPEGTRNFAIQYNTMREALIENKLMKPK